jgi:hypothetical protein
MKPFAAFTLGVLAGVLLADLTNPMRHPPIERRTMPAAITPLADFKASMPLQCDAWVVQSGTPGVMPVARCYSRTKGKR